MGILVTSIYQFDPEDARRFAQEMGIQYRTRGEEMQFYQCPYCKMKTKDKNTFSINLRTGQFKCLRATCNAHGNMITLAKDFNFSLGENTDEYYKPSRRYRDMTRYPRPIIRTPAVEYMESRGISKEITERYGITTQKEHDNILVFPFFDEHNLMQFVKYRKTDFDKARDKNKEWCEANCKPILFGMDQCDPEKNAGTLVITEGQIDSLSCAEAGIENAVSVPTGANGFTWVPYCWDFLNQYKTLIVFGDHEHGHITLLDALKQRFPGTVKHVRPDDYKGCKDANELLRDYGKDAVRAAVANAVPVKDERIKPLNEVERVDISKLDKISSGIDALDRTLGGLYMGQLIILTGERGDGKSTLASQLAGMALKENKTVFFYSGELMDWYFREWFDLQIAGPDHINHTINRFGDYEYHLDANAAIRIADWYADRMYLYDNQTVVKRGDGEEEKLLETIEKAIMQYGCKVIFIDNLMTAVDDDLSSDIYRQQTIFVRNLAIMAKEHDALIFLIAHPKKRNGMAFSNDDVAGSANITNLADVVLRYMRPPEDDEEAAPPDRILQVWKNRLTGKLEKKIPLWYDPASKRISEKAFDWKMGWENTDFEKVSDNDFVPFD